MKEDKIKKGQLTKLLLNIFVYMLSFSTPLKYTISLTLSHKILSEAKRNF